MPTADATHLPSVPEAPGSSRRLDEVGPLAVLGAMVEQKKRASQPSPLELGDQPGDEGELDDGDADETHRRRAADPSAPFMKVR